MVLEYVHDSSQTYASSSQPAMLDQPHFSA